MRASKGYLFRVCYIKRESVISLVFGTHSKAGRGVRKIFSGIKKKLQVCPDWRQLAWENCREAK